MGVVRERKSNACSYKQPQEETEIDGAQSTSENEEDIQDILIATAPRRRERKKITFEDLPILKRNTGKRKARRYFNKRNLETLIKDEENDDSLLEYYKTPFERLMETTEDAVDYLNAFLLKLEEEERDGDDTDEIAFEHRRYEDPYMRISHKIRRSMKLKKNFPSENNREIEETLIEFFRKNPFDVFNKLPMNSFERLFMHALAQYHDLRSKNNVDNEHVRVEIRNDKDVWLPVDCNLCDLLERAKS